MMSRFQVSALASFVVVSFSLSIHAQFPVTFVPFTSITPTGANIRAVKLVDVVGTVAPDLVVLASSQVRIYENPTLLAAAPINVVTDPSSIAVGDLDSDGDKDLVVASASALSVLLRSGAGWIRTDFAAPAANAVGLTDIDADGDIDIVRGSSVILAQSPGVFVPTVTTTLISGASAPNAVLGDYDADGDMDLAVIRLGVGGSAVFERHQNNGVLPFTLSESLSLPPCASTRAAAGDLDGNGTDDLVFLSQPYGIESIICTTGQPSVLRQTAFTANLPPTIGNGYTMDYSDWTSDDSRPVLRDIDGNGSLDVAVRVLVTMLNPIIPLQQFYAASVMALNDGAGRFVGATSHFIGQVAITFAGPVITGNLQDFADLNGNGLPDMVYVNGASALPTTAVEIRLGQSTGGTFNYAPLPPATIVPGASLMTVLSNDPDTTGITVTVRDATGTAVPGVRVNFAIQSMTAPFTLAATCVRVTNTLGVATMIGLTVPSTGNAVVAASVFGGASTVFNVGAVPFGSMFNGGGTGQAGFPGQGIAHPFIASIRDPQGMPIEGVPLHYASPFSPTEEVRYTNASGDVLVQPNLPLGFGGLWNFTLQRRSDWWTLGCCGSPPVTYVYSVFVRTFNPYRSISNSLLIVNYAHEDGPTPLIVAMDDPSTPTASMPAGTIYTSILSPGPSLFVIDTLGTFGAVDPLLVAAPTVSRGYSIPAGFTGVTRVFQLYAFDPTYYPDLAQAIVVSNPVTVNF